MSNNSNIVQPIMAEQINRLNKITVLNIIRQKSEVSRAEIVKKSGLSAPTVTRIVDSLINKEELAEQVGIGESSGGRPPLIVKFNGENRFVIGIDWGRTHIHGIVANLNGETIFNFDIPVSSELSFESDIRKLTSLIDILITTSGVNKAKILGIGLAVAGFVNHLTHEVEYSPNFGWNKVDLQSIIQKNYNIPVLVDNVSRVMSLGELWYGAGSEFQNFVFINIGYGIGAGIIVGGKPFTGFDGFSGEIGHIKIFNSGVYSKASRKCVCGKNDCLECYASGRGIAQTVKGEIALHPESVINNFIEGDKDKITTEIISRAAKAGDKYARGVLEEAAIILATAFANLANTINPQAIIIGGKVALTGDFFIDKILKVFEQETLQHVSRPVQIFKSKLIGEAAVKGAVALILKEVVELNVRT